MAARSFWRPTKLVRVAGKLCRTADLPLPSYSLARQEGIEPPTHSLEGCCSIQLSYWRFVRAGQLTRRELLPGRGARI